MYRGRATFRTCRRVDEAEDNANIPVLNRDLHALVDMDFKLLQLGCGQMRKGQVGQEARDFAIPDVSKLREKQRVVVWIGREGGRRNQGHFHRERNVQNFEQWGTLEQGEKRRELEIGVSLEAELKPAATEKPCVSCLERERERHPMHLDFGQLW